MWNERSYSVSLNSVGVLFVLVGLAVGFASHSLWWGVAAILALVAGAWVGFKAMQFTVGAQSRMVNAAVERLEKKLDTLAAAATERQRTGRR